MGEGGARTQVDGELIARCRSPDVALQLGQKGFGPLRW